MNKKEYMKQWREKNKVRLRQKAREYYKENRRKLIKYSKDYRKKYPLRSKKWDKQTVTNRKLKVFNAYGGSKCSICGIDDFDVLTVDHINCGGTKHRKSFKNYDGQAIYRWLIKNDFPEGFRILCRNCNWKEHLRLNFGK